MATAVVQHASHATELSAMQARTNAMSPTHHAVDADAVNLFVNYLPLTVDDGDLLQRFAPYGGVLSAKIMRHVAPTSGSDSDDNVAPAANGPMAGKEGAPVQRSKGYGFVLMASRDAAAKAIQTLHGSRWDNKRLVVQVAQRLPADAGVSSREQRDAPPVPGRPPTQQQQHSSTEAKKVSVKKEAAPLPRASDDHAFEQHQQQQQNQAAERLTVIVSPVDDKCTVAKLSTALEAYGVVASATLLPNGSAEVTYAEASSALEAVRWLNSARVPQLHPTQFLTVSLAPPRLPASSSADSTTQQGGPNGGSSRTRSAAAVGAAKRSELRPSAATVEHHRVARRSPVKADAGGDEQGAARPFETHARAASTCPHGSPYCDCGDQRRPAVVRKRSSAAAAAATRRPQQQYQQQQQQHAMYNQYPAQQQQYGAGSAVHGMPAADEVDPSSLEGMLGSASRFDYRTAAGHHLMPSRVHLYARDAYGVPSAAALYRHMAAAAAAPHHHHHAADGPMANYHRAFPLPSPVAAAPVPPPSSSVNGRQPRPNPRRAAPKTRSQLGAPRHHDPYVVVPQPPAAPVEAYGSEAGAPSASSTQAPRHHHVVEPAVAMPSAGPVVPDENHECQYCAGGTTVILQNMPVEDAPCEQALNDVLGQIGFFKYYECWGNGQAVATFADYHAAVDAVELLHQTEHMVDFYDCREGLPVSQVGRGAF